MKTDYACFAIWEHGRSKEAGIIADLETRFDILGNFLVFWSDAHYNRNIARLYESNSGMNPFTGYSKKIGRTPFRFLVVRDNAPQYAWKKSVSGVIEPSNVAVVEKKYLYRSWIEKDYQIHSSNNTTEFYLQAPLVLGADLYEKILKDGSGAETELHKELEGAAGWESRESLFRILNYANDYVLLDDASGSDMVFLTDNFQRFASTANLWQNHQAPYKGTIQAGGKNCRADIRFVADGCYPADWARDILSRKTLSGGVYVPSDEDLFFSLFYHGAVHQPSFGGACREKLVKIAQQRGFDWFSPDVLDDSDAQGKLLAGYMKSCNYYYTPPVDRKVYNNDKIIPALPSANNLVPKKSRVKRISLKLKNALRRRGGKS